MGKGVPKAKSKNDKELNRTGVLEIRLGASVTGPTKRMLADLETVGREFILAKQAAMRTWGLWMWSHRDYQPRLIVPKRKQKPPKPGEEPKKPAVEKVWWAQECVEAMTSAAKAAVRMAAGYLPHAACKEIKEHDLDAKLPHGSASRFQKRWEALRGNELPEPFYNRVAIPLQTNHGFALAYCGQVFCEKSPAKTDPDTGKVIPPRSAVSRTVAALLEKHGRSGAVVAMPVLGGKSGRRLKSLVCRLEVRQLTPGNREVLKNLIRPTPKAGWVLHNSKVVYKEGKKAGWFLQLAYTPPPRRNLHLCRNRVAVLALAHPEATNPFCLTTAGVKKAWHVGPGHWLAAVLAGMERRRKAVRDRYHRIYNGRRGHGFKRMMARTSGYRKLNAIQQREFCGRLLAELVKFCERHNCGTVEYHEPSQPLRNAERLSWFAAHSVTIDWTALLARLRLKLNRLGMAHRTVREGTESFRQRHGMVAPRERPGGGKNAVPARVVQPKQAAAIAAEANSQNGTAKVVPGKPLAKHGANGRKNRTCPPARRKG